MMKLAVILSDRGIRRETGAVLIVQPREQLPSCSQESDELFEIRGTMHQIIPAFQSVCQLLRANMMRSQAKAAAEAMAGGGNGAVANTSMITADHNAISVQASGFGLGVMPRSGGDLFGMKKYGDHASYTWL